MLRSRWLKLVALAFVLMDLITAEGIMTWGGAFFGLCLIVFLIEPVFVRKRREATEAQREFLEFDDEKIKRVIPHKREESIAWSELDEIAIATNDQGPFFDDAHWMLMNKDKSKGVAISNDAKGFSELLTKLQLLPSFNNEQVIKTMGCTDNDWFPVWKKER